MEGLRPPAFASDQDYADRLGDGAFWEPWARAALDLAGLDQPEMLQPARPLGTYPTLLTGTGLVVKLFGDRWYGPWSLHFGTFHADTALLAACLDAYGRPAPPATWAREMLAFTLPHDFNMLRPGMALERFATLDELADAVWNLDAPGLRPPGGGRTIAP